MDVANQAGEGCKDGVEVELKTFNLCNQPFTLTFNNRGKMKNKVGRPKNLKGRGYKALQVRVETDEMLVAYQEKIQQNRDYRVSKNDLVHIAVKRLVADDPI